MMYYLGEEFDKEKNKDYKTLDGAKKASEKTGLPVYDEEGVKVYPLKVEVTDTVPDGALEESEDGSVKVYDEEGQEAGTMSAEDVAEVEGGITDQDVEAAVAANREEEEVHGKIVRVFNGKLRLRREPSFEAGAVCGVSMFDEKMVKKKAVVGGKILYKTTDEYWMSGDPEHVKFVPAE